MSVEDGQDLEKQEEIIKKNYMKVFSSVVQSA
jgi:hypothetical protein